MNNNRPVIKCSCVGQLIFLLTVLIPLFLTRVWGGECDAGHHNIDFGTIGTQGTSGACGSNPECSYAFAYDPAGTQIDPLNPLEIRSINADFAATFNWNYNFLSGLCDAANAWCLSDLGGSSKVTINYTLANGTNNPVTLTGRAHDGTSTHEGRFKLTATESVNNMPCDRDYKLHITGSGGGWGDPHITTVDGVHYDFQSAGEFIALREKGLQIQTRQTPVPTSHLPRANPYTGIASCVSIYTAVAVKFGRHRITVQPNTSGIPDPSGLQLRVNGEVRYLGPDGIDLTDCNCNSEDDRDATRSSGRIVKSPDDKSIEMRFANGTKLVVTPAWWERQQKWYLNIVVHDTTATEGIMGRTMENWLPALADGSSVGPKAEDAHERYEQLYKKFADSWRVNERNSQFDYAPGTSTETFTLSEWPRENPSSCLIVDPPSEGQPEVEPLPAVLALDETVAKEHCKNIENENNRENCEFDVAVTGHTGFAEAYERAEQVTPGATQTSLYVDQAYSRSETPVTFTAVVARKVTSIAKIASGSVQFVLDGNNVENPVALDNNGNAVWSTTSLTSGNHEVVARFIPSGFGERFRASESAEVSHYVAFLTPNFALSLHAGTAVPTGDFGTVYKPSYSFLFDLEYKLTPALSVTGLFGFNQFSGETSVIDDNYWINVSANLKYYISFNRIGRIYLNAGVGAYLPETGSTEFGLNTGLGYEIYNSKKIRAEVGINQHTIYASQSDIQFIATHIGLIYNF